MCVTINGRFVPNEDGVANYVNWIHGKYHTKRDRQMVWIIIQTRSSTTAHILELAYVKLRHPAVIAANFTQIPLQKESILSNVRCSA